MGGTKYRLVTGNTFIKTVGDSMKRVRTDQNMSIKELSVKCQVKERDIKLIEAGRLDIDILTLNHIAKKLNIPLSDLFP
jgi:ribosome-binding protein aMBF1 (putative translation factor)